MIPAAAKAHDMQTSPQDTSASTRLTDQADEDRAQALALNVTFNGRHFRYRQFKYDKLADAMAYARLDGSRDGNQAMSTVDQEWLPRPVASDADKVLMERFAISVEGNAFRYQGYRYDLLADALKCAQQPRSTS